MHLEDFQYNLQSRIPTKTTILLGSILQQRIRVKKCLLRWSSSYILSRQIISKPVIRAILVVCSLSIVLSVFCTICTILQYICNNFFYCNIFCSKEINNGILLLLEFALFVVPVFAYSTQKNYDRRSLNWTIYSACLLFVANFIRALMYGSKTRMVATPSLLKWRYLLTTASTVYWKDVGNSNTIWWNYDLNSSCPLNNSFVIIRHGSSTKVPYSMYIITYILI